MIQNYGVVRSYSFMMQYKTFLFQALHVAAKNVKDKFPSILIEASGGVTEMTLNNFLGADIDVVSLSRTTQGYDVVDLSMKIIKDKIDPSNPIVKL